MPSGWKHEAVSASPGTQPWRAWEGTAPGRPVVALSWPLPRVLTSLAARSVLRSAAHVTYTHTSTHSYRSARDDGSVDGKCATRPTHPPRAWDAKARGRPVVAASHPPPRMVTSPVARSVVFGRARFPRTHTSTQTHYTSLLETMEACVECTTRPTHPPHAWEATITRPKGHPSLILSPLKFASHSQLCVAYAGVAQSRASLHSVGVFSPPCSLSRAYKRLYCMPSLAQPFMAALFCASVAPRWQVLAPAHRSVHDGLHGGWNMGSVRQRRPRPLLYLRCVLRAAHCAAAAPVRALPALRPQRLSRRACKTALDARHLTMTECRRRSMAPGMGWERTGATTAPLALISAGLWQMLAGVPAAADADPGCGVRRGHLNVRRGGNGLEPQHVMPSGTSARLVKCHILETRMIDANLGNMSAETVARADMSHMLGHASRVRRS